MIKHVPRRVLLSLALAVSTAALAPHARAWVTGRLTISGAWVRVNPPGAPSAAGYLTIRNNGPLVDRLLGGSTAEAAGVEVHLMSMTDGIMRMRPVVGGLAIGPGQTVKLASGGYHLMLVQPRRVFKAGERLIITLRFARAGDVRTTFVVANGPPGGSAGAAMNMP